MKADERLNILLVGPRPGKLLSYDKELSDLGHNLLRAASASEALELLLRTDVAVALIDAYMPELDGFELTSMIRAHPRHRHVAVILASSLLVNDFYKLKGYRAGAVDYITLPVVPEVLRAKVTMYAELYRRQRRLEELAGERGGEAAAAVAADDRSSVDARFAAVAHELRDPMGALRNALHVLGESTDAAIRAAAVGVMQRQLAHLAHLVDDLGDLGRMAAGAFQLHTAATDLADVLRDALDAARPAVAERVQLLASDIRNEPLWIEGDPARLTQAFAGLLRYVSESAPARSTLALSAWRQDDKVRVALRAEEPPGSDGAPASTPTGTAAEGIALPASIGLTRISRIIEMHGGAVLVRHTGSGRETVVEFLALTPAPSAARYAPAAPAAGTLPRVLVADDNADSLESLALVLQMRGYEVRKASDGLEALQEAAVFRPGIVVLDIGMPKLNGYDACRRMREQEWGRSALIIAVTGWGQDEDRERSRLAGFDHHLVKPVDPEVLLQHLVGHDAAGAHSWPASTIGSS